jgi:hypothetical protein
MQCNKNLPLCSGALLQHSSTLWGKQLNPKITLLMLPGVSSIFDSFSPVPALTSFVLISLFVTVPFAVPIFVLFSELSPVMFLVLSMVLFMTVFLALLLMLSVVLFPVLFRSTQVDCAGRMEVIGVDM